MSISSDAKIQNAYIDLYLAISQYIWSYEVVEHLVDLEIESFKTFVDWDKLSSAYNRFKTDIREVAMEDELIQKALTEYDAVLKEKPEQFSRLFQVNELL